VPSVDFTEGLYRDRLPPPVSGVESESLRQRAVVVLAAAARFASGILMGTGLAYYVGQSGASDLAVGLVATAYYVGMMLFAPVWGAVADVTGRHRAVLAVTGGAATLAVVPLFVAEGTWAPIGLRGLYAVFAAGFPPVMLAIASARGGDAGRGRSLGFFNSARASGISGGQVAAGVLLGALAPAGLYAAVAVGSLVSTLAVVFVSPGPVSDGADDPTVGAVLAEVRRRLLPAVEDRSHLRRNGLRWLYVALALRNATVLGVMALLPVYLPTTLGFSELTMGVFLGLNPASQIVFMYLFGRVADTSGRKSLITLGVAGSAAFALVVAGASLLAGPARLLATASAFLIIAASYSAMTTGALAFIGDVAPPRRESELMGLRSTAKGVGGVVGPVLFGGVATLAGYEATFAAGSVLAVGATVLAAAALTESRPDRAGVAVPGDD
jgi:MFS family permease